MTWFSSYRSISWTENFDVKFRLGQCQSGNRIASPEGDMLSSRLMPFADLQEFVRFLELQGQLKRVGVEVDPQLEVTEITQRVIREEGPALLFERPKGSSV